MNNSNTSKYPSQATLMAIYGCNKYQLADKMRNFMHIPDEYLRALEVYRVEHFPGRVFSMSVLDGRIHHAGKKFLDCPTILYSIIYHNCSPYTAKRAKEVRLSFRAAIADFNIEPIVLVEIVDSGAPDTSNTTTNTTATTTNPIDNVENNK